MFKVIRRNKLILIYIYAVVLFVTLIFLELLEYLTSQFNIIYMFSTFLTLLSTVLFTVYITVRLLTDSYVVTVEKICFNRGILFKTCTTLMLKDVCHVSVCTSATGYNSVSLKTVNGGMAIAGIGRESLEYLLGVLDSGRRALK